MLYFFRNSENIFLRHGLEDTTKGIFDKNAIFPPTDSYLEIKNGFPIEIDRPPFGTIEQISGEIIRNIGECSNHAAGFPWGKVKGLISYNDFIHNKGKIIDSKSRDHLYASSKIKLKDWTFVYQNIDDHDDQIIQLIQNDIQIIPQKVIIKMFIFMKMLKDRIIVLAGSDSIVSHMHFTFL